MTLSIFTRWHSLLARKNIITNIRANQLNKKRKNTTRNKKAKVARRKNRCC